MKRTRMLVLFGGLTLLLLGYVCWCWRTYLGGVADPPLTELPEDFRVTALMELRRSGLLGREEFRWRRALELLKKPYASSPPKLEITTHPHLVLVARGYPFSCVAFIKYRSGWEKVPNNQKIH